MPTEFDHITVPSQDLKKSIAFYTALGMELIEHEEEHHAHFENKNHEVIFTAYYNTTKPDYEVKVYFEISNMEVLKARFRESVLITKTTTWQGKELHLFDPDRNLVILYQKLTADAVPPWQEAL